MNRRTRSRVRLAALIGLVMVSASACQISLGTITGLPVPCTLYIGEPAQGILAADIIPGVIGVGCL